MSYDTHNFTKDVIQQSYKIPVIVDFWAEWCAPCRVLGPVLERLAHKYKGTWALVKLNTEEYPEIAQQYGIQGIPNVKLFVDGAVAAEFAGAMPEEMIEQWLQKALPSKYRGQIKQALQLLSEGDLKKAQKVLQGVVTAEPENKQATVLLAQSYLYSAHEKTMELLQNISEGDEYGDIAEALRTFAKLFQALDQPEILPEDPIKKLYLAAIKDLREENFEEAVQQFIEVVRQKRAYDDDGARKACVAIFKFLGENHEISQTYRRELSSALYV